MLVIKGRIEQDLKKQLNRVYTAVASRFSMPSEIKVNLTFVGEDKIRELNRTTRNIDRVTDVLSYPYTDIKAGEKIDLEPYKFEFDMKDNTFTFGDIYICTKRAKEQAIEYGHSLIREICFLFCHGMLHILGYDHIEEKDREQMESMQNEILNSLGITREEKEFKCGFVTILGETNAGKSSLINALVGEHVAIVSPKTQTTRENIQGVYNDDECQIVFVDTPGYHKRKTLIDDEMDKEIATAQEDTEIVLMLIVANKDLVEQYEKLNAKVNAKAKKILLINKIDETTFERLYPELDKLNRVAKVDEILPISALKNKNLDVLLAMIKKYLPLSSPDRVYYPIDEYTDKDLRHICAEIIREKALLCLDDEVPHGIQVVVSKYTENTQPIDIEANLYCEKESHKAIVLGKSGSMIKRISTMARKSIERIVGEHVNLQIFVSVKPNWRNDIKAISDFGLKSGE